MGGSKAYLVALLVVCGKSRALQYNIAVAFASTSVPVILFHFILLSFHHTKYDPCLTIEVD